MDAESELANILSTEILAEINREVVRTIYVNAVKGAIANTATDGIFDLDVDSNGRWSVEKFKGLLFQIERDSNAIGQETRRGKGNILICSADVASALGMAGVLDYAPGLQGNSALTGVDDTSSTLVGTLNGRIKVYVDPYSSNVLISTSTLQDTKVHHLMTQDYSTVLTFHYSKLEQSTLTPSNQKSGLRHVMVWFQTHSQVVLHKVLVHLQANKYYRRVQVANLM